MTCSKPDKARPRQQVVQPERREEEKLGDLMGYGAPTRPRPFIRMAISIPTAVPTLYTIRVTSTVTPLALPPLSASPPATASGLRVKRTSGLLTSFRGAQGGAALPPDGRPFPTRERRVSWLWAWGGSSAQGAVAVRF